MAETECHYPNFRGLNLTWETLEGTIKHNGPIKKINDNWLKTYNKKFPLELKDYPSLEAQIASFADDIAYNNHDIDDGFRAGFFSLNDLCKLEFIKNILERFDKEHPDCNDKIRIYAITRSLISAMVFDLLKNTKKNALPGFLPESASYHSSCLADLNRRPPPYQGDALPAEPRQHHTTATIPQACRICKNFLHLISDNLAAHSISTHPPASAAQAACVANAKASETPRGTPEATRRQMWQGRCRGTLQWEVSPAR